MPRVLFVDDEPNVLQGLRRMLHRLGHEWDVRFAASGSEALSILAESPCDVVVTDIHMPGMSGTELLEEVKAQYPLTARIVLSGQAEKDAILSAIGTVHQYLSKPCDAETLESAIVRASSVRGLLGNEKLRRLISEVDALPSLPCLYKELMKQLMSPDVSVREVGNTISKDVGMSAKVLQLVNSAFFGLRHHITNPTQAVVALGLDAVKALAVSTHVFAQLDPATLERLSLDALWNHSMSVGGLASRIAKTEHCDQEAADYALMGGLIHDVGKLLFAAKLPEEYEETLAYAASEGVNQVDAESQVIGATHAEVGAYLVGLWGLPSPVVEALAFHHDPQSSPTRGFTPLTAVHVADGFAHDTFEDGSMRPRSRIDGAYLAEQGLSERLAAWQQVCHESISEEGSEWRKRSCA
jgi:putative nucleotidyltransferase with HDIG domain